MAGHRFGHTGIGKVTHAFPGEHFLVVRPLRDDVRRSAVDAPRRSRRVRARQRQKEKRAIGKSTVKLLKKDTHQGRPTKTKQNSSTGRRAPVTMQQRPPGSRYQQRTKPIAATGLKVHRPRVLQPHPPRLYHILPIRRIAEHL